MSPAALHVLRLLGQDHRLVRVATGWRVSTPGLAGYERTDRGVANELCGPGLVEQIAATREVAVYQITEAGRAALEEA
jgi:hypothetical protein